MNDKLRRKDLIYPELSYQIIGSLFDVWKELKFGHKEKIYQKALAEALKERNINFTRENPARIRYKEKIIGIYYFDFLIDNKIVLELKVRNFFSKKDIDQLYSYLRVKKLNLGIVAHFTKTGVKFKRIVNLN